MNELHPSAAPTLGALLRRQIGICHPTVAITRVATSLHVPHSSLTAWLDNVRKPRPATLRRMLADLRADQATINAAAALMLGARDA
jgi:hypothetical protein